MIAGFAALEELTGVRRRVLGIDASATIDKTRDQVGRIARHTAEPVSYTHLDVYKRQGQG